MPNQSSSDVLNQVFTILARSFPMYLVYAHPVGTAGRQQALDLLDSIRSEQETLANRIGDFIQKSGSAARIGDFPLGYSDWHDLNLDFILKLLADYQRQDIEALENCAEQLRLAPAALALAEEALGLTRGHLELVEEQLRQPA